MRTVRYSYVGVTSAKEQPRAGGSHGARAPSTGKRQQSPSTPSKRGRGAGNNMACRPSPLTALCYLVEGSSIDGGRAANEVHRNHEQRVANRRGGRGGERAAWDRGSLWPQRAPGTSRDEVSRAHNNVEAARGDSSQSGQRPRDGQRSGLATSYLIR